MQVGVPDAAAGTHDRNHLSLAHAQRVVEPPQRRRRHTRERRGLVGRHPRRHRADQVGGHDHRVGREAALRVEEPGGVDGLAHLPVGHVGADGGHGAAPSDPSTYGNAGDVPVNSA